ncbi:cell adhesion molecule-related/down-regulated by oncogenes precursor-like [Arapaima gigas]
MHQVGPCQQEGLEMMPIGQLTPRCRTPNSPQCLVEERCDISEEGSLDDKILPASQHSCCQGVEYQHFPSEDGEEDLECENSQGPGLCWDSLDLPELECMEKGGWMTTAGHVGDIIQQPLQET